MNSIKKAYYHLPGLFEFYELYEAFLPIYREHREYFYDWCGIGSIYGAPADCIWGGGRIGSGEHGVQEVMNLMSEYGISARLTFSNSLLREEHLADEKCNALCKALNDSEGISNGVIVHSDILARYIKKHYPNLYLVSSTTKVLTDFNDFLNEVKREDFQYVVPDFRLNKVFDKLVKLTDKEKDNEIVSRQNLGEDCSDHVCVAPDSQSGYRFSKAMENPAFISVDDIRNTYMPMGFSNFKIEGRGLGSALVLEFLLYYMIKPEYQIHVREEIYLDNMLDLF